MEVLRSYKSGLTSSPALRRVRSWTITSTQSRTLFQEFIVSKAITTNHMKEGQTPETSTIEILIRGQITFIYQLIEKEKFINSL